MNTCGAKITDLKDEDDSLSELSDVEDEDEVPMKYKQSVLKNKRFGLLNIKSSKLVTFLFIQHAVLLKNNFLRQQK